MTSKILVTYASRTGSTAEVAEVIGRALAEEGEQVDVLPMQEVRNLTPYRAIVAGSAIRKSKWLPEAVNFIRTHQTALTHKSFVMFTVCITLAMGSSEQYRSVVAKWVAPVSSLVRPVSEGFFAGRLDFSKLPFNWDTLLFHIAVTLGIFPRGDHRDWNAIRAWAKSLKPILAR
jgi:menaquinone-dependent protoporphyrinogen oxidase